MQSRFALALLLMVSEPVIASSIQGIGRPIDGDSMIVGQTEVRLHGIDAPELTQTCTRHGTVWTCGSAAAEQLAKLVSGKQVNCTTLGKDLHDRTLARCRVGGTDINRTMVATGFALAYRRYSMDYVSAEDSAKLAKRGMWSSTFELPSEVRHQGEDYVISPQVEQQASGGRPVVINPRSKAQPRTGCRIKGNHSRKGELIYHLPGMPYYAETRAERMFCSVEEAEAAGFRRSQADKHR